MLLLKHPKTSQSIEINEFWLRDHCRCVECLNFETNQRRYDVLDLPADIMPLDVKYDGMNLQVHCKKKWM